MDEEGTDCGQVLKQLVAFFARFGLPDVIVSDGGPPYNSYAFVNFLEKQGIKVFKSPPYNPPSNGQAERLVRTVKEVLKKFLIDSDLSHLSLEDQINLFLINYRNTCVTKDDSFPAEKIFTYKPKTLVDLLNPKKHFLKQLVPQSDDNDDSVHPLGEGCVSKGSVDPLDALSEGAELWYKNNNPNNNLRWIKSHFIKKYSKNVFQIQIGSAVLHAHRNQTFSYNARVKFNKRAEEELSKMGDMKKRAWCLFVMKRGWYPKQMKCVQKKVRQIKQVQGVQVHIRIIPGRGNFKSRRQCRMLLQGDRKGKDF